MVEEPDTTIVRSAERKSWYLQGSTWAIFFTYVLCTVALMLFMMDLGRSRRAEAAEARAQLVADCAALAADRKR